MGKIVAIGGGDLGKNETLGIDKKIIELTGKKHPKALFIPTAICDRDEDIGTFYRVYGEELGCIIDKLCLIKENLTQHEIRRKIISADLIYVGGGSTKKC